MQKPLAPSLRREAQESDPLPLLLIDDDPVVLKLLTRELRRKNIGAVTASSAEDGLERLADQAFDVVVCDLQLPRANGLEFLRQVKAQDGALCEVIMLTGHGGIDSAIEAIRAGAFHYLTKPVKTAELASVVRNAHEKTRLLRENLLLRRETSALGRGADRQPLIGRSKPWRDVLRIVERSSGSDSTVLITGRSGTGKELIARAVHRVSPRHAAPFVAVNCASVVTSLLESELFGHEAGAFTGARGTKRGLFELAHRGTLFLDEVAEANLEVQAKLLRVLETREFRRVGGAHVVRADVRIIAATNRDLGADLSAGRFREDLFYRLNVYRIELPRLSERPDDIGPLAEHFLALSGPQARPMRLSRDALSVLVAYPWPGNVRELRNTMERLSLICDGEVIDADDLPSDIRRAASEALCDPAQPREGRDESFTPPSLAQVERRHIERTLEFTSGNKARAARYLGVTVATLYNKLKRYRAHDAGAPGPPVSGSRDDP